MSSHIALITLEVEQSVLADLNEGGESRVQTCLMSNLDTGNEI